MQQLLSDHDVPTVKRQCTSKFDGRIDDNVKSMVKLRQDTTSCFDDEQRFDSFEIDEDLDWKSMLVPHGDAEYDFSELIKMEAAAMATTTIFGQALAKELATRGDEEILRSTMHLPTWLTILAEDHTQERGAWLYVQLSRGVDLVEHDVNVPPSELDNYKSASQEYPDFVHADIIRLLKLGFVHKWATSAKAHGLHGDKPKVCHALGAVYRHSKIRITVDASRAEEEDAAINDLATPKGKTCFANIDMAKRAACRRGTVARADLCDAFMLSKLSRKSKELFGFKWGGEYYFYSSLGFGASMGPAYQQHLAVALSRAVHRKLTRLGLRCGAIAEYDKHQQVASPAAVGHEMTVLLSLIDDYAIFCTTMKSGVFSFLHLIEMARQLGLVVSPKPGKTDYPGKRMVYLGIDVDLVTMQVSLDEDRVLDLQLKLNAFAAASHASVREVQSLVGVLVFCAAVISAGRPAYRGMIDALKAMGPLPPKRALVFLGAAFKADIAMWNELLVRLNGTTVACGVRAYKCKFVGYTDASFGGYAWCVNTAGAWYDTAPWPASWQLRLGTRSKYRCIFICFCELAAIAFMLRHIAPFCAGRKFEHFCDNLSVVRMLRRHSSRSAQCTKLIMEIELICACYAIELQSQFVRTYDNTLMDLGSRQWDAGFDVTEWTTARDTWILKCKSTDLQANQAPMVRPELEDLLVAHVVRLDVWQEAVSAEELAEYDRLLPDYLRAEQEASGIVATGSHSS